jgi:hypothetical protein
MYVYRMISVKTGLPIKPLSITNDTEIESIFNSDQLQVDIQSMLPRIAQDRHYAAFYLRARAAVWLDLVLEMVNHNHSSSIDGRMTFRKLDNGLIRFLGILVQLGMGSCCEAIAITLKYTPYLTLYMDRQYN